MIGFFAIGLIMSGVTAPATERPKQHIGTRQRIGQRALVGNCRMRRLELVDSFAADIDHAPAIAHRDVFVAHAHRLDEAGTGERRCARPVHHHLDLAKSSPRQQARVDEARGGDDRRAMLIVVHHRNFHAFAKRLLDLEALGRLDVFEVDAAEARLHQRYRFNNRIGIFGRQLDIDRIDIGEALEEHRLALHHRLRGERTQIAEAKDRSAVRDHRNEVAPRCVVVGQRRFFRDRQHGHRYPGE